MGRARKINPTNLHPKRNSGWGYLERSSRKGMHFRLQRFLDWAKPEATTCKGGKLTAWVTGQCWVNDSRDCGYSSDLRLGAEQKAEERRGNGRLAKGSAGRLSLRPGALSESQLHGIATAVRVQATEAEPVPQGLQPVTKGLCFRSLGAWKGLRGSWFPSWVTHATWLAHIDLSWFVFT